MYKCDRQIHCYGLNCFDNSQRLEAENRHRKENQFELATKRNEQRFKTQIATGEIVIESREERRRRERRST